MDDRTTIDARMFRAAAASLRPDESVTDEELALKLMAAMVDPSTGLVDESAWTEGLECADPKQFTIDGDVDLFAIVAFIRKELGK